MKPTTEPSQTGVGFRGAEPGVRMLDFLNRCHVEIIRSESEAGMLDAICREAVASGGFAASWAGFYQNDGGGRIIPIAHAGNGMTSAEEWTPGGDCGPCPMLCLPIKHEGLEVGIWALYPEDPAAHTADELAALDALADAVSIRLTCHRATARLRDSRDSILKIATGEALGASADSLAGLLRQAIEMLGADAGFVSQRNSQGSHATIICGFLDGTRVGRIVYPLAGSPCAQIGERETLLIPSGTARSHPDLPFIASSVEAYAGAPLRDASGAVIGTVFLLFHKPQENPDILCPALRIVAARAGRELERRKPEALMRSQTALLDKALDAIFVHDLDYRITYWNQGAAKLYGWSAAEVIGNTARGFLYTNPASMMVAAEITLSKGEWSGEMTHGTKDGGELTVESRWSLVKDEQGAPQCILSINTDITARKKLEQQFLRTQRMESIGTLAGGIAHDINNILSPIMMSIDLLRMYVTDEDGMHIIEMMASSAKRGAEMVKQVLSFARGVEGKAEEVRVSLVVEDLLRIIEDTFPKNIRVETRLQPDLWPVNADPTQIHQVLLNLCVNARDAMPDGGRLAIKVQNILIDEQQAALNLEAHPGPYLAIEIEDSGHGIAPEILDKIFDPFFTTKAQGKGTGLGLSTTLAIMKTHGGFISAHSEPGEGSRFRIHLPATTELGWETVDSSATDLPRGKGETVMVVDDEIFIRQVTSRTLESFGYKVLLAANGSEAITTYVEHQDEIALVLTDMMMPVMDGPSTIRTLKRLNPFIPIIGASGINAKSNVARAVSAGADHFLTKPFTAETLLKTIRQTLKDPAPRRPGGPGGRRMPAAR